jgi:hypothetical protein
LTGNDLEGVHCDICHRVKDALIPDSTANPPVPGYGNGMMVMQVPLLPKRGPFPDAFQFHPTVVDSHQVASDLCGTCHNVSNPFYATDPVTQPPHAYSPIERTYSEWKLSWYAEQGEAGSCQSCHMPADSGFGCIVPGAPERPNVPQHDLTGGNTFVPDILYDFWGPAVDTTALRLAKERAVSTLREAATLSLEARVSGDSVVASVVVTNLTGHKLPTGYPEGRRMWLHVAGLNATGDTLFESGHYDFDSADLTLDPQIKVYETKPGLTEAAAAQFNLEPGPSFHFILNDTIYSDNRIPPRGFTNAAFEEQHAEPVGYSYADGAYSDSTIYTMPPGVTTVAAVLYYQTASKDYITFLRDENAGNEFDWNAWGESLYVAWERHGKSTPVVMDSAAIPVGATGVDASLLLPDRITLSQNYPNPFNPTTRIRFSLNRGSFAGLRIHDVLGREVGFFAGRWYEAGTHEMEIDARSFSSGVYLYSLEVGGKRAASRKMLIMK